MLPPIVTKRLIIREYQEADWQAVHLYAACPSVTRYLTWGPNTEEQTQGFVRAAIADQKDDPREKFHLAITRRDGSLIGGCSLYLRTAYEAEIGYCIHPGFWGQGYATEAAGALLALGFEQLGLHRIYATCDPRNARSARVLEKIGMRREGHLKEHLWQKGEWRDSYLYAILEREWRQLSARQQPSCKCPQPKSAGQEQD